MARECPLYQDDNAPFHTAKILQEWFAEDEGEVGHLDWPPQSPDLNIIEHLWGYLESKLRARFPPPSTILALETALHEEWLHIPLQVVHDLYASIPCRIQSVIQSNGGPTPPINKAFLFFHRMLKMEVNKENIRFFVQFFFDKSKNTSQVAEIANDIYGANTVTANYVQFWFRRFRSGIFDVKDALRTGKPQTLQNVLRRKLTDVTFGANWEASFATRKIHATQPPSQGRPQLCSREGLHEKEPTVDEKGAHPKAVENGEKYSCWCCRR
ncbi:transposable element Tcb2 transposase [Trichonephila clavipes]|nr:transposable element Tcb2 transposase [Trichonephila clavipes]